MIPILLLCGCGMNDPTNTALQIRELYSTVENIDAETTVFMDLGERTQSFRLSWVYDGEAGSKVTVIEPESVSGISITTSDGALTFEYDSAVLVVPVSDGLSMQSPIEELPRVLRDFSDGVYTECSWETLDDEDVVAVTYEDSEHGRIHRVWFRRESLTPVISEIYLESRMAMRITYDKMEIRGKLDE